MKCSSTKHAKKLSLFTSKHRLQHEKFIIINMLNKYLFWFKHISWSASYYKWGSPTKHIIVCQSYHKDFYICFLVFWFDVAGTPLRQDSIVKKWYHIFSMHQLGFSNIWIKLWWKFMDQTTSIQWNRWAKIFQLLIKNNNFF